ncbi:MAG: DUF4139 domain-containing protein [Gammaproteobacteria bacterium]|nr:DUF4139 domain-containing protein [Gammaproteobacteria bacterium]
MANFHPLPRPLCAALAAALLAAPAAAQVPTADTALTIYSTTRPGGVPADQYRPAPGGYPSLAGRDVPGYAVIRQQRRLELDSGLNRIDFRDVAAYIDPTTVTFESLTAPDTTRVIEQNFRFDLVSADKLLDRYIDQIVTVDQVAGDRVTSITGRLLSTAGALVLQSDDGRIHAVRSYQNVHFHDLPGGLITRPTLVWDVAAERAGTHDARIGYQTAGLTWWADYNLVFREGADANSGAADVHAWVSVLNRSGASFDDARLKLIAGDVNRAEPAQPRVMRALEAASVAQDAAGFDERSFFEFHLYTLGRTTTLPGDSTKQIELFPKAADVPVRKKLVYYGLAPHYGTFGGPATDRDYGLPMNTKVDVYLELDNRAEAGLGVPLPAGRLRVSQLDPADSTLEFIGEDVIDHTPKDETVRIRLGSAFDVVGERRQTAFRLERDAERMEESIEIRVRNHKTAPVEVLVREVLFRWTTSEILESSHDWERDDARTVHFPVTVPADGEVTVRYTVRYTW